MSLVDQSFAMLASRTEPLMQQPHPLLFTVFLKHNQAAMASSSKALTASTASTTKVLPSKRSLDTSTEGDDLDSSSEHSTFSARSTQRPKPMSTPESKRCVSFCASDHHEIQSIPGIDDYSREEINSTWYGSEEMFQFRHNAKTLIQSVNAGLIDEQDGVHLRGLESRLLKNKLASIRFKAWNAVLDEQQRQWDSADSNEQFLADIYIDLTAPAQSEAYRMGRLDQIEAAAIQKSPNTTTTTTTNRAPRRDLSWLF